MKVISHRGAKGLATENSLIGISAASKLAVSYIEFDIQHTKDNKIVVYHDRKTPQGRIINAQTYRTVKRDVSYVPLLSEALKACGTIPALIESKTAGTIAKSLDILSRHHNVAVTSFIADEILATRIHLPNTTTIILQHYHPFGILKKAQSIEAHGIGVNIYWMILFPYLYYKTKKLGLIMSTYTVNSPLIAKVLYKFFPELYITTDIPDILLNEVNNHAE